MVDGIQNSEIRIKKIDDNSFMHLNLLLRNPAYTNLYDLYV
jgi:hypothetical protein